MIQVQLGLFIRFAKEITTSSLSQKILHELGGFPLKTADEEGVRLKLPAEKLSIIWTSNGCSIRSENLKDAQSSSTTILNTLSAINELVVFDQLSDRRLGTCWILPMSKYTLKELEQLYRQEMMTKHSNYDGVYDSSVILDIKREGKILHHQSGPMDYKQLKRDYLRYELKDVPQAFLFLEASVSDSKTVKYSFDNMRSFMLDSFSCCESHSKEFESIWGGRL